MKPEGLLPCSQEPAFIPLPEILDLILLTWFYLKKNQSSDCPAFILPNSILY
jgi:hypothetical protein